MKNLNHKKSTLPFILTKLILMAAFFTSAQGCFSLIGTSDSTDKSIADNIENFEYERENAELTVIKKELAELKPSINRLLVLESDFAELLETLQQVDLEPTFYTRANAQEVSFLDSNRLLANDTILNTNAVASVGGRSDQLSLSTTSNSNDKFSQVSVGSAAPVLRERIQTLEGFTNSPAIQMADVNDKFSNAAANSLQTPGSLHRCNLVEKGQGYAMHIASFSKKDSADILLRGLIKKLNENDTCQREAFIAKVVVKGQTFFSARIGSFLSRLDVTVACSEVKKYTSYCGVTKNIGELL